GKNFENAEILKTSDGGSTWISYGTTTHSTLHDLYFLNSDTGFAVGESKRILKTTDGGINWINLIPDLSIEAGDGFDYIDYMSIHFINSNIGYIVGGDGYATGIILKTINGGEDWFSLKSSVCPDCEILKDGPDLLNNRLESITFSDENNGYIVGYGIILKTSDGGESWFAQEAPVEGFFKEVIYTNFNVGYIVGYDGVILKTTNEGKNWIKIESNIFFSKIDLLESINFINSTTGYVVGDGIILKTSNGGESWIRNKDINYSLNSMYSTNDGKIFFVGDKGIILKMTEL
ncbi:hypothetical protein JYT36_01005, partial [Bacteroidales bacterium AH-315-N07]|nr:hypothetical protein [Bacteroidales bacterium AH-315-N07]